MYTVDYIDRYGREQHKLFQAREHAIEFIEILDERIERGTCFGYTLSN